MPQRATPLTAARAMYFQRSWSWRWIVPAVVLTSSLYWIGSWVGIQFTLRPEPVAVLWPPNAILLAALLLVPMRLWWMVLAAVLPVHLAVQLGNGVPVGMALSWYVSNCSEALLGAAIVRKLLPGRPRLDSMRAYGIFVLGATLVATVASTFLDAGLVALNHWGGSSFWSVWSTRFWSNVLATQIIVPLVLACDVETLRAIRAAPLRRCVEAGVLFLAILLVCIAVFTEPDRVFPVGPALLYVPLPLLLWAAVRFGLLGVSASLAMVSTYAIRGAVQGDGPFTALAPAQNAFSVQLFLFLSGVPLAMLAVLIEERRRAQAGVRDSQRLLALTVAGTRIGLWSSELDTNSVWVDDNLLSLTGVDPQQADACAAWMERIDPRDAERMRENLARALLPDTPRDERGDTPIQEMVFRLRHGSGSIRWMLFRGTVLRNAEGEAFRASGIAIDISEQQRIGDELKESDERLTFAAAAARIGFWSIDEQTDELWLSEHCYELLGLDPDAPDVRAEFEAVVRPAARRRELAALEGAGGRSPPSYEFPITQQDGRERWFASSSRRVTAPDRPTRVIGVIRDITEQRHAEQAARDLQHELAHLARVAVIGELAATIVHELGQPVSAVMLNAQAAHRMLERGDTPSDVVLDVVGDILRDGNRAGDVIGQLRQMLRRNEREREALDMRQIVRDALALTRSELVKENIDVTLGLCDDASPVMGNRAQLQQVLLNLILNARDAMSDVPHGLRQLRVAVNRTESAEMHVTLADTGTGIPTERIAQVFEPFVTSKAKGLGLGLAISRSIMVEHGGDLRAENGKVGAVMHVTLPAMETPGIVER